MNRNILSLMPVGMPRGVDPRTWRQTVEKRINELLDQSLALITALDVMEADCDLEDDAGGEPWLGWTDRGPTAAGCDTDDRELDCEDEGAQCDDEGVIDSGIADLDALGIMGMT